MPKRLWTPRVLLFYNSSCLSDRAVRRVEESWFGFLIAGGLCSKPGRSLCERIKLTFATAQLNLLLQLPQDVSTRYRSVDMTVLAAFATLVCQRHCVFLCKGTKAQEFCKAEFLESLPVFVLECFPAFVNRRAVSGFGLGFW